MVLEDVETGHPETRVGVGVVAVDDELPVVDAPGKADAAKGDAMFVAFARDRAIVLGEEQLRRSYARVEGEPSHCNDEQG